MGSPENCRKITAIWLGEMTMLQPNEPLQLFAVKPKMSARHSEILTLLHQRGFVSIGAMADSFQVSEQTVRRDLMALDRQGLITKFHGGAGLPLGPSDVNYEDRKTKFTEEKRLIAAAVARRIPENATIFIDIGTTMEAVAEALLGHERLTVITTHLSVAMTLSRRSEFQILLAGGVLRHRDHSTTGEATREFLERFRVDYGIFGIGAIDEDGGMLDFDFRDIGVTETAFRISKRCFAALDHSKFKAEGVVRVGHVSDIDTIFTDQLPPGLISTKLDRHRVEVVLA